MTALSRAISFIFFTQAITSMVHCHAQSDSLLRIWQDGTQVDTVRLAAVYRYIQEGFLFTDPDSAILLSAEKFEFAKARNLRRHMADANYLVAGACYVKGDFIRGIDLARKTLRNYERIGFETGQANCHNLMANIYAEMNETDEALQFYQNSLRIRERIKDPEGVAASLNNIGLLYCDMGEKATDDMHADEASYFYNKAEEYLIRSISQSREINFERNLANALMNLGLTYHRNNRYPEALEHYKQCLGIKERQMELQGAAFLYNNIGLVYADMGDHIQAVEYCSKSLKMSEKIGALHEQEAATEGLYENLKALGRYEEALKMLEINKDLEDSLVNDENTRAILHQQFQYDFEKKEALINAEKENQAALSSEKLRKKTIQQRAVGLVLALALTLAAVIFFFYRRKQRDNDVISAKIMEVEEMNHHILESIAYAKKLQEAVLPPPKSLGKYFNDSFLLYLPKDIVSGDFYWIEARDNNIWFAVGDCTGHGVPGAMLSVIGLNGLNRCLNELNLSRPSLMLEQLTQMLRTAFERSEARVRDGMDLAVCSWNPFTKKLIYSGANIALWISRGDMIEVVKPARRPVGFHDLDTAFTDIELVLEKGTVLYLTTDGYSDQMGGPAHKKMKSAVFREHLTAISSLPLPAQNLSLEADFATWRGSEVQTDDICVMGIRL